MVDDFKQYFTQIVFEKILRDKNRVFIAMATIYSLIGMPQNQTRYNLLVDNLLVPSYVITAMKMICIVGLDFPWYDTIFIYLRDNILPPNLSNNQRRIFIQQYSFYVILADTLYRWGLDGTQMFKK